MQARFGTRLFLPLLYCDWGFLQSLRDACLSSQLMAQSSMLTADG